MKSLHRAFLIPFLALFFTTSAFGYDFWSHMLHGEALLDTLPFQVHHYSSYARNGGNSDLGGYYGTAPGNWRVLCDVSGPGVLAELWFTKQPLPDTCRIRIFVDDTTTAVIDTFAKILCGHVPPFTEPLADSAFNSWYSFVPVSFRNRLRVHYRGTALYYHLNVLALPAGTNVASFSMPPSQAYLARLDSLRERFLHPTQPVAWTNLTTQITGSSATVPPRTRTGFVDYSTAGGCRRLFLTIDRHTKATLENVWVRIFTDSYPRPDFEAPISTLFGAALGWYPYQSIYTGMMTDTLYLNLPIPFRNRFRVDVENRTDTARTIGVWGEICSPTPEQRGRFKLHGEFRDANPTLKWYGHDVAGLSGAGTFFGLLFDMQAPANRIYEGDESVWLNGETSPSWLGTGTDDYFMGGYYWLPTQGSDTYSSHGCIRFTGPNCAAYRWNITDPAPFASGFRMHFQVGPFDDYAGHYRSLAFIAAPRERWQVADTDGDGASFAAETLHVVGQGLIPGTQLISLNMGLVSLPVLSGNTVADADSVLDVLALATDQHVEETISISAQLSTGTETAAEHWIHHSRPTLDFAAKRADEDSLLFKGDTLNIFMAGMTPGAETTVSAMGTEFPWAGSAPQADASGKLKGMVTVPAGLFPGDHAVEAHSPSHTATSCGRILRLRPFFRMEIEELPLTTYQISSNQVYYGQDYVSGDLYPWGRGIVRYIRGQGIGAYVDCRVTLPAADSLQTLYFFGKTGGGAKARISLDGEVDIDTFDTYAATPGLWRWARSDTVRGSWHYFSAGVHVFRFEIVGRNASSTNWEMILDQAVLTGDDALPVRMPQAVKNLTAYQVTQGVRLRWKSVIADTAGSPLIPEAYAIYRALGPDSLFHLLAEIPGTDTVFVDAEAPVNNSLPVYYAVTARVGAAISPELREAALGRAFAPGEIFTPAKMENRSQPVGGLKQRK